MSDLNFNDVDVMLVDPDLHARESLKMILRNQGFRKVELGENLADIRKRLEHTAPDLLITAVELPEGSVCPIINAVRHHEFGVNPFLPVIAVTANPNGKEVREIVNSGADDLLIKPLSTTDLIARIKTLVNARKPFVVTSDYIGPDRRKTTDRPTTVPLLRVPNTLEAKAKGDPVSRAQAQIRAMISEINEQKLDRHIYQFRWLAEELAGEFEIHGASAAFSGYLDRLAFVGEDAARRVEGTAHDHIAELCRSLVELGARLREKSAGPGAEKTIPRDLAVLAQMTMAVQAGFTAGSEAAAREISEELKF
ncbi:MAG: response regulator [Rhodospirillales bacterium]|nr:response regulator [Rhodospirillales bacterium]